jgi:hypothetical protein
MVDGSRLYPDWARVRKSQTISLGYKNLFPGESKLAPIWNTSKKGREQEDFFLLFLQIQTYYGRRWNGRYGYITPDELVVQVSNRTRSNYIKGRQKCVEPRQSQPPTMYIAIALRLLRQSSNERLFKLSTMCLSTREISRHIPTTSLLIPLVQE